MIIFDIETAPLSDSQLLKLFSPPDDDPHPGEFDPNNVKLGNVKKQETIDRKIEEARTKHQDAVRNHEANCTAKREAAWQEFKDRAALDATTGHVLAIGYHSPDAGKSVVDHGSEAELIARFWAKSERCRSDRRSMIGLNIHDFDLPFLMRRSWILQVDVPSWTIQNDRYFDRTFVDLRKVWACGQYRVTSNFDHLGKVFETGGKPDGTTGADFARLWLEDREKAIAYLLNDLQQPAEWAKRMGVL